MKEIQLSQGQVALVDDEDYESLAQFKWYAQKTEKDYYAARVKYGPCGTKEILYMHRVIMNAPEGSKVDHRFHETLNNQKYNLRVGTHADNMHNTRLFRNNTSGHKGVSYSKRYDRYNAYLMVNRKVIPCGSHRTLEAAIAARKAAELKHHGEYACEEIKVA